MGGGGSGRGNLKARWAMLRRDVDRWGSNTVEVMTEEGASRRGWVSGRGHWIVGGEDAELRGGVGTAGDW